MLAQLRVRDLVLIEELDIDLAPGFNALTGETGAGKSLVAAALDLLLGRRASGDLVRRGATEAEVEGLFDVSDEPGVRDRLEQAGLPAGDDLLVRRIVPAKGRHRCYVNGKLASLSVLSDIASGLAAVMGQHEHHALLEPAGQLGLLDGFAGLDEDLDAMASLCGEMREAARSLARLSEKERDRAARLDYLDYQIREIDDLAPRPGEIDEIEREIALLSHRELLLDTTRRTAEELYEDDGSVFERLGRLERTLGEAVRVDSSLLEDARQLAEASVIVEEAARRLSAYGRDVDSDPARLDELEERRETLRRIARKHGIDPDGLSALRDEMASERDDLARYEESLALAEAELERCRAEAMSRSAVLSKGRAAAARRLSRAATRELADLAFGEAKLEVRVRETGGEPGPAGSDEVEFVVALNPGEGAHPLRRVASGGELSRLMLAIRRVLAGVGPAGTYVFDEVDAGIGGAVAAAVGRKLRQVAARHQVICITHLPQIAGMSDAHFLVSKGTKGRRTATRVERLDEPRRLEEIARMLGGDRVTDGTRAAARDLIAAREKER